MPTAQRDDGDEGRIDQESLGLGEAWQDDPLRISFAQNDESRELVNECSVWDAVVAATAYARGMVYQDARVDIERAAGKMLHSV